MSKAIKLRLFPLLSLLIAVSLLIQGTSLPAAAQTELEPAEPAAPTAFSCDSVTEIPKIECEALVALYDSTNAAGWTNKAGWLQTNTPCSWYGSTCSQGHIQGLGLQQNQLTGAVAPQLVNLVNLQSLFLGSNQLTGAIPSELANLTNLQTLWLYGNRFAGTIPSELANLTNLQHLSLGSNQLTGAIPSELANLTNLQYLDLWHNQLVGAIPPQLGNLTNLWTLWLESNQLTGTIPPQLGNLANLQTLALSGNQLIGAIPPQLGNLAKLSWLQLDHNQLTGVIPAGLGSLPNLEKLYLDDHQLTGPIPSAIGGLVALKEFTISHNPLGGALPATLTVLNPDRFWYDATDLCELRDSAFQAWLGGIPDLRRTDVLCGDRTVSGAVWDDQNRNGTQDTGEPPLPGLTVTLSRDSGALAPVSAGRQVVTDGNGSYQFATVAAGAYRIDVAGLSDYLPTAPGSVAIIVPEDSNVTVPPIGFAWAPAHLSLPLVQR